MTDHRVSDDDEPRYGERMPARQAPQYGEYAPPGWVSPVSPIETPPEESAQEAPVRAPVRAGERRGYDAPPPSGQPVPGRPPTVARRSSFNGFATWLLLVFGGFNVVRDALSSSSFATMYAQEFKSLGYVEGTFRGLAALHTVGVVSAIASLAVFAVVAVSSLRRLRAGRTAWVVPLLAGIVVNIVTGIFVVTIVMGDPSFVGAAVG